MWKKIKMLQNKPTSRSILLREGDDYITTTSEVSEELCKHFSSRSDGTYIDQICNSNKIKLEENEITFDTFF